MISHNTDLIGRADAIRREAITTLIPEQRGELGQFFTPLSVASMMARLIGLEGETVRILDPGAGAGTLLTAAVEELSSRTNKPASISAVLYELDEGLAAALAQTVELCREVCAKRNVMFNAEVIHGDFVMLASADIAPALFGSSGARSTFDLVITNPPYRKINSDSEHRRALREAGVETSNLYTGFLGLAVQMLADGGELIAITPRSFCNGPYFRPFRDLLLHLTAIQHIHVIESRREAFKEDDVLQENIIFRAVRGAEGGRVVVTASNGSPDSVASRREIGYEQLVWPHDPQKVIHIVPDPEHQSITDFIRSMPYTLDELGIDVSTGRVVDFRAKAQLRADGGNGIAPLIYPGHFEDGFVRWPKQGKKPNGLAIDDFTRLQLVPNEAYVLTKRFSAKEERRRVVAAVYDPDRVEAPEGVGFENHINYFHAHGGGLGLVFAKGLAVYLNSTPVDAFFRQFSGHTQVNASDLRGLFRYPSREQLNRLGNEIGEAIADQQAVDTLVEEVLGAASTAM